MNTVKVTEDLQIELSLEIKKWLRPEEELAAFLEGDTLILKKVQVPKLSALAEQNPKEEMLLEEISKEVHRYREEKKSKNSDG
ncbi:MAG: hypothetical protein ACE5HX_06555 [bacterium]